MHRLDHRRHGTSVGYVLVLCGLFISVSPMTEAAAGPKKCDANAPPHMTAARAPQEPRVTFSRTRTQRLQRHGSAQSAARRSLRLAVSRLSQTRAAMARQEQILDASRIRVIDGDTFAYGAQRIRLQAFNAPESGDAGGGEATERLEQLLRQAGVITMVPRATDIYGRTVAEVFVDRRNIADQLEYGGIHTR